MLPLLTPALEAFINLADRIINLEKTKFQDKQTLFNEIVKPLFVDLEPIAVNYLDIFRKARNTVEKSSQLQLQKLIALITEEREVMVVPRIKVEKMAFQIQENIKDEEICDFAKAIEFFFGSASGDPPYSHSREFLNFLKDAAVTQKDKHETLQYINESLYELEHCWSSVVESYAKLKIYSVSPTKYINKSQSKKNKPL